MQSRRGLALLVTVTLSLLGTAILLSGTAADHPKGEPTMNTTRPRDHFDGDSPRGNDAGPSSLSPSEAIERAANRLGLSGYPMMSASAEIIELSQRSLPFLGDKLSGKKAWQIVFRDVDLEGHSGEQKMHNKDITELSVVLAPQSGEILTVNSNWPDRGQKNAPYPQPTDHERRLRATSTTYTGLPDAAPAIHFLDALKKCQRWGPGVQYVRANYLFESSPTYRDRPVWVVYVWGASLSPPVSIIAGTSADSRNFAPSGDRNVIDAKTGKWLYAESIPHVRLRTPEQ